ncbi:putative MoxY [Aspergillus sergii]|uniref:Putative MoxY n=1 Tax=Aspergillus sergii TaxID=1034303 RepID=A0A5N6WXX9_9EURO|nr:putative MoxY [Aspergillus sergii]
MGSIAQTSFPSLRSDYHILVFMGMGAAGINFAHSMTKQLQNAELTVYERNDDMGGTWLENRYPGCACDIPSLCYQFSWQRKPDWSQYYAGSREIWVISRMSFLTTRMLVRSGWSLFQNGESRLSAIYDPKTAFDNYADFFLNGGCNLNAWNANWDDSVKLDGKRVLVVGAGSSAVQIIPTILPKVDHLHIVARSPTWITAGFAPKYAGPGGAHVNYLDATKETFAENPELYLRYSQAIESELSVRFRMVINNSPEALEARKFSEAQMRQKVANKPELVGKLMPKNFGVGCRRPAPGNVFLEALTEDKTTVGTENIKEITQTGFDTTFRPRFPLIANGRNIQDDPANAPGYLGLNLPEVPSYFKLSAPYGPLGHGSALSMIEGFTNYILQIISKSQVEDIRKIQVSRRAAQEIHYLTVLRTPRYEDYEIEYLTKNRFNYPGDGFDVREYDGRDLTWYYGLVDGQDKQPTEAPPPMYSLAFMIT